MDSSSTTVARTSLRRQLSTSAAAAPPRQGVQFATHGSTRSPVKTRVGRKGFESGTLCHCIRLQLGSPDVLVPLIISKYQDECLPHVRRTTKWLSSSSPRSSSPRSSEPAAAPCDYGRYTDFSSSPVHSVQGAHQYCAPQRQSKAGPREAPHVIASTSTVSTGSPALQSPSTLPTRLPPQHTPLLHPHLWRATMSGYASQIAGGSSSEQWAGLPSHVPHSCPQWPASQANSRHAVSSNPVSHSTPSTGPPSSSRRTPSR